MQILSIYLYLQCKLLSNNECDRTNNFCLLGVYFSYDKCSISLWMDSIVRVNILYHKAGIIWERFQESVKELHPIAMVFIDNWLECSQARWNTSNVEWQCSSMALASLSSSIAISEGILISGQHTYFSSSNQFQLFQGQKDTIKQVLLMKGPSSKGKRNASTSGMYIINMVENLIPI